MNCLQLEFSTFPMPDHEARRNWSSDFKPPSHFFTFYLEFQNLIELVIPSEARVWRVFATVWPRKAPKPGKTFFDDWIHKLANRCTGGAPEKKSKNHKKTLNRVGPAARPCSPAALRDISRDRLHSAQCTHWRPYSLSSFKFAPRISVLNN